MWCPLPRPAVPPFRAHLRFVQEESARDLDAARARQVLVEVELLLEFRQLLRAEVRATRAQLRRILDRAVRRHLAVGVSCAESISVSVMSYRFQTSLYLFKVYAVTLLAAAAAAALWCVSKWWLSVT